jgi:hypothetical protein
LQKIQPSSQAAIAIIATATAVERETVGFRVA